MANNAILLAQRLSPLKLHCPYKEEELVTVKLYHEVEGESRKFAAIKITQPDIELILRGLQSFDDACRHENLHLNTGPLRFSRFLNVLPQVMRDDVADIRLQENIGNDLASFDLMVNELVARHINAQDVRNIKTCMSHAIKPRRLSALEMAHCF